MPSEAENPITDTDGHFRRKESVFRDFISADPGSKFPAEKDRYVLYANYGCPWAHRAIIVRELKSLESIVQLVLTDFDLTNRGWLFTGKNGSADRDPLYGFSSLSELYFKADPNYSGRFTVPTLWDKKTETIVNNESSEIIRMFYSEFDALLPSPLREVNRPGGGFYPPHLRPQIDAMNDWVYHTVNNGVYKCGFATTQAAYDANVHPLFASLDRLERHLAQPGHSPYLFGAHLTEADVRLYTTLARFDVAYVPIFQCNLGTIRHDYPRLHLWLRHLYWDTSPRTNGGVFHRTTFFRVYKYGYATAKLRRFEKGRDGDHNQSEVVLPAGPVPDMHPLDERERALIERQFRASASAADEMQGSGLLARREFEDSHHGHDGGGERADGAEDANGASARKAWPENDELEALEGKSRVQRRTTYSEENKRWEKEIKKAGKDAPPPVHLAL